MSVFVIGRRVYTQEFSCGLLRKQLRVLAITIYVTSVGSEVTSESVAKESEIRGWFLVCIVWNYS